MSIREQRRIGFSSLVLLGLAFVAAVMASNALLSGYRVDLTENHLFTISPGTREILTSIQEPINLYLFFSEEASKGAPFLRTYEARVREMLNEFQSVSEGKLVVHVVDPVPFSDDEDRATEYGLKPANIGNQAIYFGLAGTNSVGDKDVIGFFQPGKEAFLEYDLAKLVYNLANPDKVVVGLLSGVSMDAGFDPRTRQITRAWTVTDQARQLFELRKLPASLDRIDDDVDVLWLVHPKSLDQKTLYAIDQFILKGGRALIFVDPLAEIDMSSANPEEEGGSSSASGLKPLFDAWGIRFSADQVVADNVYALSVNGGPGRRPMRHLGILGVDQDSLDQQDVVTAGLNTVDLSTAGYFTATKDQSSDVTFTPLITSSAEASAMPVADFQFLSQPESLLDNFKATGERYVLAARLQGKLDSAFPDGPPAEPAKPQDSGGPEGASPQAGQPASSGSGSDDPSSDDNANAPQQHLSSGDNANIILVGDVDILSDRLWVQAQNFLGQQLKTAFANNGDFVVNALDNLSGSAALIGIRSRADFSRPFTTVEALRREADAKFRQTEQQLQKQLTDTENKLGQLQAGREDEGSLLMTPEQQQEIQQFLDEQVRIRRELRTVRRNLDRSIEQLGATLKVVNIGLMPFLLTVIALVVVALKRNKKATKQ
jgi:ABC-type uncharacterized transport system involved in gliding motility auxiliary subunit